MIQNPMEGHATNCACATCQAERREIVREQRRVAMRAETDAAKKIKVDAWLDCTHMRDHPYVGMTRIAWAEQSDGVERGVCQLCGCIFSPNESELLDPFRLRGLYEKYHKIKMEHPVILADSGLALANNPFLPDHVIENLRYRQKKEFPASFVWSVFKDDVRYLLYRVKRYFQQG